MHFQSGVTALKVAQSEAHQEVYDILLQYTQEGAKVIHPEKEVATKAVVAEVSMDNNN